MTGRTGTLANIGIGQTNTWGTADTLTSGDKAIHDTIKFDKSPEELTETGIGSGYDVASDSQQGATTPTVTGSKTLYYNDAANQVIAAFWGGTSISGNANGYTHSMHHGGFDSVRYITAAQIYASNSVVEMASGAVTKLGFNFSNPKSYAKMSYELLGDAINWTGTTNNYSTLNSTITLSNSKKVFFNVTDTVSISGATYPVTDVTIDLTKDYESAREAKGSSGNSSPIPSGDPPFQGTITLTFRQLKDHTFFSGAAADSTFYMTITLSGDAISGSANYTMQWRFPALKIIQDPQYETSSGGYNPYSVTFKVILASTVPSGMYTSYPHMIIINDKSAAYFT